MNVCRGQLCVFALIGAGLLGCNGGRTIETGTNEPRRAPAPVPLVAKAKSPIADVSVPMRFSLDQKLSRSMQAGVIRMVDHRYTGKNDKWAVGRFFKRQMPLAGWILNTDMMIRGTIKLRFTKGSEFCEIAIDKVGWGKTEVQVIIGPIGRATGAAGNT